MKFFSFVWCDKNLSKKICRTVCYAGLIVLLVPIVISETDKRHLTFDNIFNSTKYAQIQEAKPYKPLNINFTQPNIHRYINSHSYSSDDDNSLEDDESDNNRFKSLGSDQLLVGYSYDPYRYSVPESEFAKGTKTYQPQPADMRPERGKRGVGHLYNMIYCATGCEPLSYKGYGCYCGFLGEGRPTDEIDRCCRMHDKCYENLYCPFFTVYFQPYYWKCYHGEPLCALENYETRHQMINGCAGRLCECDRQLAMCLRRFRCPRKRALCRSSPLRLLQNVLMLK